MSKPDREKGTTQRWFEVHAKGRGSGLWIALPFGFRSEQDAQAFIDKRPDKDRLKVVDAGKLTSFPHSLDI